MLDPQVLAFAGVAALLTITPGADTMLVMRSVLARGQRAGLLTTLGICAGCLLHAAFSAFGLSLILMRSATAYETVKWLGAGYLVYLGVQSLRAAWRVRAMKPLLPEVAQDEKTDDEFALAAPRRAFVEGLLTNLLNPKVAIFYLAFLPQFLSPGDPVLAKSLLLALIHAVLGVAWLSLITVFLGRMRTLLERPRVKRSIEAAAGTMLILFGLRLALEKR
jgi:RhtB (resistance to homoserine/threonine) family protein